MQRDPVAAGVLDQRLSDLILERAVTSPFLVGVAGAVAVGKTTTVRAMAIGLESCGRSVRVVSTDAFLLPNRVLNERGLLMRKGFPESYDADAIGAALSRLRAGETAQVNVYSHDAYDILAGVTESVAPADVVFVEGVVALQEPTVGHLDLRVYVDAPEVRVRQWFVERFVRLVEAGTTDASSFYHRFSGMPGEQVRQLAEAAWDTINGPNLHDHIAPSAASADIVVLKAEDHSIADLRVTRRVQS
jgi:type I pantothenate kinase